MNIRCRSCQHEIHLDDTKVPEGVFKLKCPKCGKLVTTQKGASAPVQPQQNASSESENISPAIEAYVRQEIANAKNEIFGVIQALFRGDSRLQEVSASLDSRSAVSLDKKALVCHDDPAEMQAISSSLKSMGYLVESTSVTSDALKKLEMETFQVVVVNHALTDDKDGGKKVLGRLNGLKPMQRRQSFVVLISPNVRSGDTNQAFVNGVNLTVNDSDMPKVESLIREGQRYFQQIYYIFNRVLQKSEERALGEKSQTV